MFKRIAALIRGFFGLFISNVEKHNPEILIANEEDTLRKRIVEFNKGLQGQGALVARLDNQIKDGMRKIGSLNPKIKAALKIGHQDTAKRLAAESQSQAKELKENQAQFAEAKTTYNDLVRARDAAAKSAADKIKEIKNKVRDTKMKNNIAAMNQSTSTLLTQMNDDEHSLSRLDAMASEQNELAAGAMMVSESSKDFTSVEMFEAEQEVQQETALADWMAMNGMEPEVKTLAEKSTSTGGVLDLEVVGDLEGQNVKTM